METTLAVDNDNNKVDGDGATGNYDGAITMGDDNENDEDGNSAIGDGATGYDDYVDGNGQRREFGILKMWSFP